MMTTSDSLAQHINNLNPEQQEAVRYDKGALLILAGAGTGKTRTLTTRIAYLLREKNVPPHHILAVTFTNKAAREMRERIYNFLEPHLVPSAIGTFHSLSVRILRKHAPYVGLKSNFTILDQDDQIRLIKEILTDEHIDNKRVPERAVAAYIDQWKNQALTPAQLDEEQKTSFGGRAQKLYMIYQERLKNLNATDFGDLILHVIHLFLKHKDIADEWQQRFHHILVDEYQDTNAAQYLWLRLLAEHHKNVCCVGDDDQSIYGWRGAQVSNILRFNKDFDNAHIIRLERNYRSTNPILRAAGAIVGENKDRLGKNLWTDQEEGHKVQIHHFWDSHYESAAIAHHIERWHQKQISLADIAILVRTAAQMRSCEEALLERHINYHIIGGARFYERQEIRDLIAYLRLINEPNDDLAFRRIINVPRRGVGNATLAMFKGHASRNGCSLFQALTDMRQTLKGVAGKNLTYFYDLITLWRKNSTTLAPEILVRDIIDKSGYRAMLKESKDEKAKTRLENINELVNAVSSYQSLADFLEHVSLVMEQDESRAQDEAVQIMTLHAAKGLEFKIVFLPGWEEGLLPHSRSLLEEGTKGLEEERRLAYVGITRAREHVMISTAARRRLHGQWQDSNPSRFLRHFPEDVIEVTSEMGYAVPATQRQWDDV